MNENNFEIENVKTDSENTFFAIAMRGMVAFPKMVMHFDIARPKSVKAVENAIKSTGKVFLVAQKDAYVDEPDISDLYKIGVVAEIRQVLRMPDGVMKILIEGSYRASITELDIGDDVLKATVKSFQHIPIQNMTKQKLKP